MYLVIYLSSDSRELERYGDKSKVLRDWEPCLFKNMLVVTVIAIFYLGRFWLALAPSLDTAASCMTLGKSLNLSGSQPLDRSTIIHLGKSPCGPTTTALNFQRKEAPFSKYSQH